MDLEEIKELLQIVNDSGVAEFEVESGDQTIRIRRTVLSDSATQPPYVVVSGGAMPLAPAAAPMAVEAPQAAVEDADEPDEDEDLIIVTSPIVGTFYDAPQPDAPSFVEIGDKVSAGQVLCIIEAMKLMNEIECESDGVVVKRFAANAQPVQYGEALFGIKAEG